MKELERYLEEARRRDAQLAEARAWQPLNGDSTDYGTLDPRVGIWVYHEDGREISVSTSEIEIFAKLPDDLRLCIRAATPLGTDAQKGSDDGN